MAEGEYVPPVGIHRCCKREEPLHILVVHPWWRAVGGAELVALHTINYFLRTEGNRITILSLEPPDLEQIRRLSGIELPAERIAFLPAECPRFLLENRRRFLLLQVAFLHRAAKGIARDYDLCVSTYNELDFRIPGIQYIHHPLFASRSLLEKYVIVPRRSTRQKLLPVHRLYDRLVLAISGNRRSGIRRNLTLVNSGFMRQVVREEYGIGSDVVYPSFMSEEEIGGRGNEGEREFGFLSVSRIAADKYLHDLVEIYARLHVIYPQATFTLAGLLVDREYHRQLVREAERRGLPLRIMTDLSKEEIIDLYRRSRYYINPKPYEHFGISIVQAIHAGVIPFVHESGGSIEIVPFPELRFMSVEDIVGKGRRVVEEESLRRKLEEGIAAMAREFRTETFYEQLHESVSRFLPEQPRS